MGIESGMERGVRERAVTARNRSSYLYSKLHKQLFIVAPQHRTVVNVASYVEQRTGHAAGGAAG